MPTEGLLRGIFGGHRVTFCDQTLCVMYDHFQTLCVYRGEDMSRKGMKMSEKREEGRRKVAKRTRWTGWRKCKSY